MPPPKFPNVAIAGGIEELRRRLVLNGDDFLAGYGMIKGLMDQQNNTMAMQVVKGFTGAEGCPKYFHFLEAEIAFRMQDYPSAWKALQTYESAAE